MNRSAGFTLVELIMTMVIIGIISAVAIPRFFDTDVFRQRGFADQVQATLRYAQKVAIAQHRFVCVAFGASSITLTYDTTPPSAAHLTAACPGSDLTSLDGQTPYTITAPGNVTMSGGANFSFDALGRPNVPASATVGTTTITVEPETGYVHQQL